MIKSIFSFYTIDSHGIRNYSVMFSVMVSFILLAACVAVCGHYLLIFEGDNPLSNINSYGDAVWVLTMVASTIGFGDFFPVTLEGRVVSGFISFIGMGLYSFITSTLVLKIMSWTDTETKNRELRSQNAEIIELAKEIVITNVQAIDKANDIESKIADLSRSIKFLKLNKPESLSERF